MKKLFSRRPLALALALALCLGMTPFMAPHAFADGPAEPPATTGDSAIAQPDESEPASPKPAAPEDTSTTGDAAQAVPGNNRTTGDAVGAPFNGLNSAHLDDAVLTITWNDNGTGGTSLDNNEMKTAIDQANLPQGPYQAVYSIKVVGNATEITKWNWNYLLDFYPDYPSYYPLSLDLSGMANLKTVSGDPEASEHPGHHPNIINVNFSGCSQLQTIGEKAFSGCTYLNSVDLSGCTGLTEIPERIFSGCTQLRSVNLSGCTDLTEIPERIFSGCTLLRSFDLSRCTSLTEIPERIFSGGTNLSSFNLSGCTGLTEIPEQIFSGCSFLNSVDLSGCTGLAGIPERVFSSCSYLDSLDLSGCTGLAEIPERIFSGCSLLRSVDLSGCTGLTSIGEQMFSGRIWLASVNLSGCTGLTSIGAQIFSGLPHLATVDLSGCAGLTKIPDSAFALCPMLTTVDLSRTQVASIGKDAFLYCSNLGNQNPTNDDGSSRPTGTFTVPKTLKSVGESAFNSCSRLCALTPEPPGDSYSLNAIGQNAFANCSALTQINLADGLDHIADHAFANCGLQSVAIPSSVTTVCAAAFYPCPDLETVTFADGSKLKTIEKYAFLNCKNLQSVNLPGSLSAIGEQAFADCGLQSIIIPDSVTEIPYAAFWNCKNLAQVTLGSGLKTIGEQAFQESGLQSVTIPANVTEIGMGAFYKCTTLEAVKFAGDSRLTSLGESAFNGCEKLSEITFPEGITSIENSAFKNCTNLGDITFPEGLKTIKNSAFKNCSQIKNVCFQGPPPALVDEDTGHAVTAKDVFNINDSQTGPEATLLYYPQQYEEQYGPEWLGTSPTADLNKRAVAYDRSKAPKLRMEWSKPGKNGNPPAYEVWDTVKFRVIPPKHPTGPHVNGDFDISDPTGWLLFGPESSPSAIASYGVPAVGVPAAGHAFPAGGPYTGVLYPSRDRTYGMCTLEVESNLRIYVGSDYGDADGYRSFSLFSGNSPAQLELLPPPTPAEASWRLTVQNGAGGGYYEAEQSAPVVAQLTAEPPVPGAKFLRWELVSGTGTFADANAPETRFTMAVGDSTVRAVFDAGAATAQKPLIQPGPTTTNPSTGDHIAPGALGALLLAAAAALLVRKKVKR